MKKNIYRLAAAVVLAALTACEPEGPPTVLIRKDKDDSTKSMELVIGTKGAPATKTSLGSGVEDIFTGAVIAVYNAATGMLDSEISVPADKLGGSITVDLPAGSTYNLYLLGNLWYIDRDSGERTAVMFPVHEAELRDMVYMLDGGAVDSSLRRENFSDAAVCGIPLYWTYSGLDPQKTRSLKVEMRRLFAKLVLTVDNSGLNGTTLEDFVNGSIHLRQSNARIMPFAEGGSRAESAADVLEYSDCDTYLENGLEKTYVYYVPENMQGVLLSGNSDPALKDIDGVKEACGNDGKEGLLTYVEFRGSLTGANTGISGDLTYRFFLGMDAVSDFNVARGCQYNVHLSFKPGSVFVPDWKIEIPDGLTDNRDFYMSSDIAGRLPDGKVTVVRKNRPGEFTLVLDLDGSGENRISSARLVDDGYTPASLSDIAWSSDFYSAGSVAGDFSKTPYASVLADLGITVSYSGGKLTFTVTDTELFREGENIPLRIKLYPDGKEINFTIATYPDLEVNEIHGLSIGEDFYVAQKRELSFSGFAGSKVYYAAYQPKTGRGSSARAENFHWKTGNSEEEAFPVCHYSGSDIVYPYSNYDLYADQSIPVDSTLPVYAFYTNHSSFMGTFTAADGSIIICSDDAHNDGAVNVPLRIRLPDYVPGIIAQTTIPEVQLPFDGKPYTLPCYYVDRNSVRMQADSFDQDLYERYIAPSLEYTLTSSEGSLGDWAECVLVCGDADNIGICMGRTTIDDRKMEDEIGSEYKTERVTRLVVGPNARIAAFFNTSLRRRYDIYFLFPHFSTLSGEELPNLSSYLNDTSGAAELSFSVPLNYSLGDHDYLEYSEDGPVKTYTCRNGEVIYPVTRLEYEGTSLTYTFSEKEQVRKSSSGEAVPGPLLVPYGRHCFSARVTNRWDGRTMELKTYRIIRYSLVLGQLLAATSGSVNASVLFTTEMGAKYAMEDCSVIAKDKLIDYVGVLGQDEWHKHIFVTYSYWYNSQNHGTPNRYLTGPAEDCSARYFGGSVWTEALMKKITGDGSSLFLNGMYLYVPGTTTTISVVTDDPVYTGNEYLKIMNVGTRKLGYLFRTTDYKYW